MKIFFPPWIFLSIIVIALKSARKRELLLPLVIMLFCAERNAIANARSSMRDTPMSDDTLGRLRWRWASDTSKM